MKNDSLVIVLVFLLITVTGVYVFFFRDILSFDLLWQDRFPLEEPFLAVADDNENTYIINKAMQQIVKADASRNMHYIIKASDYDHGENAVFKDLTIDRMGNLYALVVIQQGSNVLAEEILQFSPRGRYIDTLHREIYKDDLPIRPGHLTGLSYRDGSIIFYDVDGHIVSIHSISLTDNQRSVIKELNLPPETYLQNISGYRDGFIYYSTRMAALIRVGRTAEHTHVYPPALRTADGAFYFPVHLAVDMRRGGAYFTDIGRRAIVFIDEDDYISTVLTQDELTDMSIDLSLTAVESLKINENGLISLVVDGGVLLLSPRDGEVRYFSQLNLRLLTILFRSTVWLAALILVFMTIWLLVYYYLRIKKGRVSLITKQIMVFVPVFIISMSLISWLVQNDYDRAYRQQLFNKLSNMVHLGARSVDSYSVERITSPVHFMNEDFIRVNEQHQAILTGSPLADAGGMYSTIYRVDGGNVYIMMYFLEKVGTFYPIKTDHEILKIAREGTTITGEYSDTMGNWIYARGPLYSEAGDIIAVHEIGYSMNKYSEYKSAQLWRTIQVIFLTTLLGSLAVILSIYLLLLSIRKLRQGVTVLAEGNLEHQITTLNTRDEIEDLAHDYNAMARKLLIYITRIKALSESYYRFFPEVFLTFLRKDSILDVDLGDSVKEDIDILYCRLHGFVQIVSVMTPEESFRFVNSFLQRFGSVVQRHRGLLERYLENGFVAYFPGGSGECLSCAADLQKELIAYNEQTQDRGAEALELGVGVHRGEVMIGIIGEEQRLQGYVFSENVSLAAELEQLTVKLGTTVAATGALLKNVSPGEITGYRSLGLFELANAENPVELYDIYTNEQDSIRLLKEETRYIFEEGVMLYQEGQFFQGRQRFLEVIDHNRYDLAAKIYFFLCDDYYKNGTPDKWKRAVPEQSLQG